VDAINPETSNAEVIERTILEVFEAICGEFPGAVVVRCTHKRFQRFVQIDREEYDAKNGLGMTSSRPTHYNAQGELGVSTETRFRISPGFLPLSSPGPDQHCPMSTPLPATGNNSEKPICLLSLGRRAFTDIMSYGLTFGVDAGGPQGISQLLILKDVMEKLSEDEISNSEGSVKRPCEVFDMIGGSGTGGSVWFHLTLKLPRIHNYVA